MWVLHAILVLLLVECCISCYSSCRADICQCPFQTLKKAWCSERSAQAEAVYAEYHSSLCQSTVHVPAWPNLCIFEGLGWATELRLLINDAEASWLWVLMPQHLPCRALASFMLVVYGKLFRCLLNKGNRWYISRPEPLESFLNQWRYWHYSTAQLWLGLLLLCHKESMEDIRSAIQLCLSMLTTTDLKIIL